jgi:hypothetical protein
MEPLAATEQCATISRTTQGAACSFGRVQSCAGASADAVEFGQRRAVSFTAVHAQPAALGSNLGSRKPGASTVLETIAWCPHTSGSIVEARENWALRAADVQGYPDNAMWVGVVVGVVCAPCLILKWIESLLLAGAVD